MAGSSLSTGADIPDDVHKRVEGIKFLAEEVNEPIAILNAEKKVVYTNSLADSLAKDCPLIPSPPSSFSNSSDVQRSLCFSCHATSMFHADGKVRESISFSFPVVENASICPLSRALPINDVSGDTHFALLMGASSSEDTCIGVHRNDSLNSSLPAKPHLYGTPQQMIIGESVPVQQLLRMIQSVAASEATVLIQGESGTGKELVAKTIHALSHRRDHPFVVVECSSLPETLLESELFGHVRGAFTGAVSERKGLFEEAEGGTIFLDEIADTTPAFQARLLRVLQEGEIKPVGSNQSIKVNVRVLSAGNIPLEELVAVKKFRADLYYRLAVLPLIVPSLRDRKEDILVLARHFLKNSTQKHGRAPMMVSQEARLALMQYQWPGNVRELENIIERGVVTCHAQTLTVKDLFIEHKEKSGKKDLNNLGKIARREVECKQIIQALQDTKGDKTRAARLLNISRSSLYNKLRAYNIL